MTPDSPPVHRGRELLITIVAFGLMLGGPLTWDLYLYRKEHQPKPAVDGVLSVRSAPPGARVLVDGREVPGRTPLFARNLRRGTPIPVEVRLDGYRPWSGTGKVHEKYGDGVLLVNLVPEGARGPASAPASAPARAPGR